MILRRARLPLMFIAAIGLFSQKPLRAQLDFEAEPISYQTAPADNAVENLQSRLERGEVELAYDDDHGYLRSVLQLFDIPVSSQVLVFSKTSLQIRRITKAHPRAVYFNDDIYVGWVQNGDVIEVSVADNNLGAVFYTLDQERTERPRFVRDRGQCIACHASSRTSGVPGHLMRSVYAGKSGTPYFGSGTYNIDHSSPFERRFGGWYVSGTHGELRHMGNVAATKTDGRVTIDSESGANVLDLHSFLNTDPYLSPHSDLVALMVLAHQAKMHNLISRASIETRIAKHYDKVMNKVLGRPEDHQSQSTTRRIHSACEKLVQYMLFCDEIPLESAIAGTSTFVDEFVSRGPRDSKGRSLREFDLSTRLMKYPCSYLINTDAFDHLPDAAKQQVFQRLFDILTGKDKSPEFAHLSDQDCQAIFEILLETKKNLPEYWKRGRL